MFVNQELSSYLANSSTIKSKSLIVAEWNMNIANNIEQIGNYRYRPYDGSASTYGLLLGSYDPADAGNFYTGATDADVVIDGGFDDTDNTPILFKSQKQKNKILYSLEDCFGRFRPRSGINKLSFGINSTFLNYSNPEMFNRPRYYMPHKEDNFKYWTSYRTEDGIERGIANKIRNGLYYIDDAVPYVVYKDSIPVNRIVIKMQTNVGNVDLGPFANSSGTFSDPFYGNNNKTTPVRWKIQYLNNNDWIDAISFNETSTRSNGEPIIGADGYVEIGYGLIVPEKYTDIFSYVGEYASQSVLPANSSNGKGYLVRSNSNDIGQMFVFIDGAYETFTPKYGWYLQDSEVSSITNFVTSFAPPKTYVDNASSSAVYTEIQYIRGIRVVVETMNKINSSFDLIEISPRLVADLSDMTIGYQIQKIASDLGISGLPVGQLLASVGSIDLFDSENVFNSLNQNSIIAKYLDKNLQFKFYEIVIQENVANYYVPIKTMYIDGFPQNNFIDKTLSISLRDLYFYLESIKAPELLIPNVSLSYAISLLLDSIGYSNYVFKRLPNENDPIIQYFFTRPEQSIAEVLSSLAVSTQSAMFFDEYNNFIVMSKNYMLPENNERPTDLVLYGNQDAYDAGVIENEAVGQIANIQQIASKVKNVYNDGRISYRSMHIQKSVSAVKESYVLDSGKNWIYTPALLWEVAATENTKSVNEESATQSGYALSAIPLNSNLTDQIPVVVNHQLVNNIIDLGEAVYWISRYNGYFYANGEIIKYDAVEYSVSGITSPIWVSSLREYQGYFSKLKFNGKMYPTGRVRIYAEPNYETINGITRLQNGAVAKHGRGQFGTKIANHTSGIDPYWTSNDNVYGCNMKADYLFGNYLYGNYSQLPAFTKNAEAGLDAVNALKSTRLGVIKNYMGSYYLNELDSTKTDIKNPQSVQASALTINGPDFSNTDIPINHITYVSKSLNDSYKYFGTRIRILGKLENTSAGNQTVSGSMPYYNALNDDPEKPIAISGGSGGLGVLVNPQTNNGYFLEIIALSESNLENYGNTENIYNVVFYKVVKNSTDNTALPIKLWSGFTNILVNDGTFTGQSRVLSETYPSVYDLGVEYLDIGKTRRFYLYLNGDQVGTVIDDDPLDIHNNAVLFVRGASKCMFENIHALSANYSENSSAVLSTVGDSIFANTSITLDNSFRKYAVSGIFQSTYLSGISPSAEPKFNGYYDEFGTIMREAAYFNIKYDKAYPALYSKISPTFSKLKGYTVSGYFGGAYSAEFLVFNATDSALVLDEKTGNYLRIQGITFTQNSNNELSVDDYFAKVGSLSNPAISSDNTIYSPIIAKEKYEDIKFSRLTYGRNEFSIDSEYIQSHDEANNLMQWLSDKIMKPRISVGLQIFPTPTIQLGDIVKISHAINGQEQIALEDTRFIVYNIDYSKGAGALDMVLYLSEV